MTTAEYNRAVSKFDDELDGIFAEDWRNLSESWRLYITETFVTDENVKSDLATKKAEEYIRMGYAKAHDLNLDSAFVLSLLGKSDQEKHARNLALLVFSKASE